MKRSLPAEQTLVVGLALARFAFCCYRATHQSIVIDEAYTYNRFLHGPWSLIYSPYDANNHILFSILAKLSIQVFGLSEFSFRLPSLVAGFFLILGAFRVLQMTTSRLIRWVAVLALSLHPMLLDFSIAARGYGMALALLTWAIYFSMRQRYLLAGALLGLAASANLTIVFPVIGLMAAVVLLEKGPANDRLKVLAMMLAPAETVFWLICFVALRNAELRNFYIGYPNWRDSVVDLISNSIHVAHRSGLFGNDKGTQLMLVLFIPFVATFMLLALGIDFVRNPENRVRLIPVLTLVAATAGVVAAHYLFRLNYPMDRTGLYLLLLFGIAWAISTEAVRNRGLRGVNLLLAGLLIVQFATQFETGYFLIWRFDMDTKSIAQMLKTACDGKAEKTVAVSATWVYQPALEFYREALHITALQPVEHKDQALLSGHDFYVLQEPDTKQLQKNGLHVLFADPAVGVVLAAQ